MVFEVMSVPLSKSRQDTSKLKLCVHLVTKRVPNSSGAFLRIQGLVFTHTYLNVISNGQQHLNYHVYNKSILITTNITQKIGTSSDGQ